MNFTLDQKNFDENPDHTIRSFTFEEWVHQEFLLSGIDLEETPPNPELIRKIGVENCAKLGVLPWQDIGSGVVVFIDDMSRAASAREALPFKKERVLFVPMDREEFLLQMHKICGQDMLNFARNCCPENLSVRNLYRKKREVMYCMAILIGVSAFILNPTLLLSILMVVVMMLVLGNSSVRFLALIHYVMGHREEQKTITHSISKNDLPVISLLVPLYREPELLETLIDNINRIDYPKDKLDVKLVLEADDTLTLNLLDNLELPAHFEEMRVPHCPVRTKPKAMNYALPFCRGEIVGIYDAESRPNQNQLLDIAQSFHDGGANVAAVQCELGFYNTTQNWFTRCFTIEYHIWFSIILPTMQYFKMPVLLGGTSVFFNKNHLEAVGGWDAHNVTEDADLGVRFKREGYETLVIASKTTEEANSRGISWIRQRSRWLKGYVLTWASHMKNPVTLYKDLGLRGFVATQILFIGAFGNYLAVPFFWLLILQSLGADLLGISSVSPQLRNIFFGVMIASQSVSLGIGYLALKEKGMRHLIPTWLTLPLYWPFGSVASYKALFELIFKPFYWDKTKHGFAKDYLTANDGPNLPPMREAVS